ncbi:MAG: hypothetical protein R3C14_01300 [Caldilineaceae bacterium]
MYKFLLATVLVLLSACTQPSLPATPTQAQVTSPAVQEHSAADLPAITPTAVPTAIAATEPTALLVPTATNAGVDWLATVTVEGDYYILGNPAAPIRLIDYSDFL